MARPTKQLGDLHPAGEAMRDDVCFTHNAKSHPSARSFQRSLAFIMLLATSIYAVYALSILSTGSSSCPSTPTYHLSHAPNASSPSPSPSISNHTESSTVSSIKEEPTSIRHVVFGIAASARLWNTRKHYIKLWWRGDEMRGAVWLDKPVRTSKSERRSLLLPPIRISADTASFPYTHKLGHRNGIRISRIVSESLRLGLPDVRWFVMGDDDTVFVPDNLVRVLSRFDHRQFYYIGSHSESHLQNIYLSYGMAFGGGGFAISYPLAVALSRMQDRCINRYPGLYGSDDRMHACMAELGVPLTRHAGFHQYDVHGDLFGLLASHPVAPLVSLHHLDVVEAVFPNETRVGALARIFQGPLRLDPAATMQQSICYDVERKWTVSVSWGFAVQVIRGVISAREMEMPARTFLNWLRRADYTMYAFNTRPVARNECHRPFVYYLEGVDSSHGDGNSTVSTYGPRRILGGGGRGTECRSEGAEEPTTIDRVVVHKRKDPSMWERAPRRDCCRVRRRSREDGKRTMTVEVGACNNGEIVEL